MKDFKIDYASQTIEMSKKFAKAAGEFGSYEYKMLQQVRTENSGFHIAIVDPKSSKKSFTNGLDYKYMEAYIEKHDDENHSIMNEYKELRGLSDEAKAIGAKSLSYGEIKKWFLEKYPAIEAFYKKREAIFEEIDKKREATKKAESEKKTA